MKKIIIFLLLLPTAFLWGGCGHQRTDISGQVRLEVKIINESNENKQIYIRYPVVGGLEDQKTLSLINNSIVKYVETQQSEFANALNSINNTVLTDTGAAEESGKGQETNTAEEPAKTEETAENDNADAAEDGAAANSTVTTETPQMSLTMTFKVVYNQDNILNITEKFFQVLGEKKKAAGMQSFIFDLKRGSVITLGDLFDFSGDFTKVVNQYIQKQIAANQSLLTFEDKSGFNGISKDTSYYIDGKNLYIFYDAYEIGPSKTEIPTFTIPLKEVRSYLSQNYQHLFE